MKRFFLTILLLFAFLFLMIWVAKKECPFITLPRGAQHNTIGELPFVEMMDDGDFYEKDGDEYYNAGFDFNFDSCYERNPENFSKKKMRKLCIEMCKDWVIERARDSKMIGNNIKGEKLALKRCKYGDDITIGGYTNNIGFVFMESKQ